MNETQDDPPAEDPPAEAAARWLKAACAAIDGAFGEGHAAANPALVGAFLQACAVESAVRAGTAASGRGLETATRISRETQETLLKLKPRLF